MRHLYRIKFTDNSTKDCNNKKELIDSLKTIDKNTIQKIEWYRSNGFWTDMTNQYLK